MAIETVGNNTGNSYTGVVDTTLDSSVPATAFPAGTTIGLNGTFLKYGALKFTGLSGISPSAVVTAASLHLYQISATTALPTVNLYRLLRNWNPTFTSWNNYDNATPWTAGGAQSDGNDKSAALSLQFLTDPVDGVYYSYTSAQFLADIQDMVANPGSNFGHLMVLSAVGGAVFASSDGTDGTRPFLTVTYSTAGSAGMRRTLLGCG